jgi:hypothetical protein
LEADGFTLISVALDKSIDDAREWIEAAGPRHPALIDVDHRVADLYHIINVPTVLWIDAAGRIVRPNDVAFANDALKDMHGIESGPHHDALRAWVREGRLPLPPDEVGRRQTPPTPDEQLARAEYGLAWHLHQRGQVEAAERHFARADQLAPDDFTIRRGSMPIRGKDPFGADFADLYGEWIGKGRPYYAKMRS